MPARSDQGSSFLDYAARHSPVIFYSAQLKKGWPLNEISWNVETITGHKRSAFIKDPDLLSRFIHPDDLRSARPSLRKLRSDGAFSNEFRLATAKGAWRWFRDDGRVVESGGKKEIVGCLVDITTEKDARSSLGQANELVERVLEACPLPIRMTRLEDGEILYESPSSKKVYGGDPRRAPRIVLDHYVDSADRKKYVGLLKRHKHLENHVVRFRRANGEIYPGSVSARLIEFRDEKVIVSTTIDLTQQYERENELQNIRETLEDAIEALSEGFALYDAEDRLVMCNSRYRKYNPTISKDIGVGKHWKEYQRLAAERGQFPAAKGRIKAWLKERAKLRKKFTENVEYQQADGRWYSTSTHKTRRGGTVFTKHDITHHKELQDALRESEQMIRRVLEACGVPVSMTRVEAGSVIYESPAASALYSGKRKKAPATADQRWADPSRRKDYLRRLLKEGFVENYEIEFRKSDGSRFPGMTTGRLIDYQGETVIVSSVIDLTEQKAQEAELREVRGTLEDAIESLSEGFVIWDADDRLIMCNSHYREINSICSDMLVPGVKWEDLMRKAAKRGQFATPGDSVDEFLARWKRSRKREHSAFEIQHADGRWFIGSSYRTRQGGRAGVRVEITELKEMEQALRKSENLVRLVLEACPVPITMNQVESGDILYESPAAKELYAGKKSSDQPSVLQRWADLSQRKNYLDALMTKGKVDGWEIERIRHDGTPFWALESARVIDFEGKQVIVSSVLDLTERYEKDAEIARQREALHQSEKLSALGELLAGVSHEINNPLSVLVGQAQLLQETTADTEIAHRAEKIGEAANRCARIVKSFLSMARQEPAQSRPSDINEAVMSALEITAYGLRASDVEVDLDLGLGLPAVVLDPDQFGQVVTNLLVNAQHALDEIDSARKLTVETKFLDGIGSVVLIVSDNGPGMSGEIQKRIFEPLYTTKEVGAGTGIGLALCHRIIATHGGSISVDSEPGKGARFTVSLPATGRDGKAERAVSGGLRPDDAARILVVDDEPDVAAVISEILESDGHDVAIAHSGEEALNALAKSSFDIILTDLRMPHLDGPGLYRRLEVDHPELRKQIAFLTGDTLGQRAREFLRQVDCPFIEKPVTAAEVRDLVASLLNNR